MTYMYVRSWLFQSMFLLLLVSVPCPSQSFSFHPIARTGTTTTTTTNGRNIPTLASPPPAEEENKTVMKTAVWPWNNNNTNNNSNNHWNTVVKGVLTTAAWTMLLSSSTTTMMPTPTATTITQMTRVAPAMAAESRLIGQIAGSGLVFKDTLNVESFDDPKVRGVTLYISNFQRPLTERLSKDFFSDPSYASVGCARTTTGTIEIADNINTSPQGEEVFEESKSLLFKTLRVQRIYDKEKNTVVYVSFNTRLDKNEDSNKSRFKSSICAVNLN